VISIGKVTGVEQAARYLMEAVAEAHLDYYAARGEAPGRWAGRGATALELSGEVTRDTLESVLSGRDPRSGTALGRRFATEKVVAFDVTFSCPKSVSLLYALGDAAVREHVLQAMSRAADEVIGYLQAHAGWGRRFDPTARTLRKVRADLVVARFVHRTARPVTPPDGGPTTVDPQLHTHLLIPTWVRRDDGSWGQLHSTPLYLHAAAAGAVGQAVLRDELIRRLGVEVEASPNGCFEVVGITRAQREEFSRRTRQVAAMEEATGADSFLGHKLAVLASRQGKKEVEAGIDLFADWRTRAATVGLDDAALAAVLGRDPDPAGPRCIEVGPVRALLGAQGMTAEAATFSRSDLVRLLAARAPRGMDRDTLERAADHILGLTDEVVPLLPEAPTAGETPAAAVARFTQGGAEVRYSTPEMIAVERGMLAVAVARQATGVTQVPRAVVAQILDRVGPLTGGQRQLITAVCSSGDGVTVVEGAAGTGKSAAAGVCREILESRGYRVVGCAVAGRAAVGLQEEAGFPCCTVEAMLRFLRTERLRPGTVLVVDEAGMAGSRTVAELVELSARDDAKLVLIGDPAQLQPLDAGAGVRALGEELGRVRLTENIRQAEAWERQALTVLRQGESAAVVRWYLEHDRVRVARNAWERRQQVVADHVAALDAGLDAVMLARTRDECAQLNALARAGAEAAGRLSGSPLQVNGHSFQVGDIALCLQTRLRWGIANGLRGEVVAIDHDHGCMTLHALHRDPTRRRAVEIDTRRYDQLEHGYALTVHKAQGITVDVALVVGTEGAAREWAYTALSRARMRSLYYVVDHESVRDVEGVHHWRLPQPAVAERIEAAWGRSAAKDSTLDYVAVHDTRRTQPIAGDRGLSPAATWPRDPRRLDELAAVAAGDVRGRQTACDVDATDMETMVSPVIDGLPWRSAADAPSPSPGQRSRVPLVRPDDYLLAQPDQGLPAVGFPPQTI